MEEADAGGPVVSVIIPSFNRRESLLRTVDSLCRQSYPAECLELIVVDDGSTDDTQSIAREQTPFALRYVRQASAGATEARNHGARVARGKVLVFVDDDITPLPDSIEHLVSDLLSRPETICVGTLRLPARLTDNSVYARYKQSDMRRQADGGFVSFQRCLTGLLAVRRADFLRLGMFCDPTGGWPNWDDFDFGYRAHRQGFHIWRSSLAAAEHWDYALLDVDSACDRWYRAGKSAPRLIEKYPELKNEITVLQDKGTIDWRQDRPAVIGRKLARRIVWSRPAMWVMRRSVRPLERRAPESELLHLLYRWTVSSYIFHGYHDGLREAERPARRVESVNADAGR
jgi:glycosyltransferase involved in cell wall biosynthesis